MRNDSHWLATTVRGLIASIAQMGPDQPICFLIGAGGSLSSGAPHTTEVVEALMRLRPDLFPDEAAVYEKGHTTSQSERDGAIGDLFKDVVPHIGYRCLVAMARTRPVIVIDLNWDDCLPKACEMVGLTTEEHSELDLESVEDVSIAWSALQTRKHGLLSVHPHGLIRRGNLRFATNQTLTIEGEKLALLRELMSGTTIVVGTSLTGPRDVTDLVKAMNPRSGTPDRELSPLWVFERGARGREPNRQTPAGDDLRKALAERSSTENFIADPEVDFDLFMATLRASEVGLTWNQLAEHEVDNTELPDLTELVLPNPNLTRSLLDADNVLLTGRAQVGKSVIAHLVAHWHAILAGENPEIRRAGGRRKAIDLVAELEGARSPSDAVLVCDKCLGEDVDVESATQLAELARRAKGKSRIVMSSAPQPLLTVLGEYEALEDAMSITVLNATSTWTADGLRRYAHRIAGERTKTVAQLVGRIDRDELQTPAQVSRAFRALSPPHEDELSERKQLTKHVEDLCRKKEHEALLLALLRFQDLSHPRPKSDLVELTGAAVERVLADPWDLVKTFQMDAEYLRLSDAAAVAAVDQCIEHHHRTLAGYIEEHGEPLRWALEAMAEWDVLHATDCTPAGVATLKDYQREMFGPELVRNALATGAKAALDVLEALRASAHDEWALKDVSLVLAEHWDQLKAHPGEASALRDRFLEDSDHNGAYALFESLLRRGGWAPPTLWWPVVTKVLDMALRDDSEDERARRRQVALCFDALLWRTAPAHESQHAILLDELLNAGARDPILRSMFAVSVAYHHNHAQELNVLGLSNPLDEIGHEATEEQAEEMAWMVAWHFIHQSRNRAVASRRFFNSTHVSKRRDSHQRLLNRMPQETPLPTEWADAVRKVASIMGKWQSTAGWALHLVMNIHATSGKFDFGDLDAILKNASCQDPGLVSASITYRPTREVRAVIRDRIASTEGNIALLAALGRGLLIDEVRVLSPRFLLTHEEWNGLRERWNIDDEHIWRYLKLAPAKKTADRWLVLAALREAIPAAVAQGATEDSVLSVVDLFQRGDTRPLLAISTQARPTAGRPASTKGDPVWVLIAAATWLELNAYQEEL